MNSMLDLVRIDDHGKVCYQALTDDEFDNLVNMEADYTHLDEKFHFSVTHLGEVFIPSVDKKKA